VKVYVPPVEPTVVVMGLTILVPEPSAARTICAATRNTKKETGISFLNRLVIRLIVLYLTIDTSKLTSKRAFKLKIGNAKLFLWPIVDVRTF